ANENIFDALIILWGSERGFDRTTRLSADDMGGGVRIADLNRDGYLDIIVGAHSTDPANPKKGGIPIFWGSKDGFSQHNRSIIQTDKGGGRCPMIADFNNDGWLDLASGIDPNSITFWWGGPDGFSDKNKSELKVDRESAWVFVNT